MKHLLRNFLPVISFLFFVTTAYGQAGIPNGDFESWPPGNFDNPEHWDSPNETTQGFPFFLTTVEKTTDSHSGEYAAQLTSGSILGEVIPGLLTLGELVLDEQNPEESEFIGIPFSERPASLEGFYKYMPQEEDFGVIGVLLSRYNLELNAKDTIAFGFFQFDGQDEDFASFSVLLDYLSFAEPDSMNVVILSSASPEMQSGSRLIIDDLSLGYSGVPVVDLGDDVFICPGEEHVFDLEYIEDHTYTWIDLETGEVLSEEPQLVVDREGVFQAVVQNPQGLPGFDTVQVFMHDAPEVFEMTGGGEYSQDEEGVAVGLSGSQTGVNYFLYRDEQTLVGEKEGTGEALSFGLQTEGVYTAEALDNETACMVWMEGQAEVVLLTFAQDPEKTEVTLFPNPATTVFNISGLPPGEKIHLHMKSLDGSLVFSEIIYPAAEGIWTSPDLSALPPGHYLLVMHLGNGKQFSGKIILSSR